MEEQTSTFRGKRILICEDEGLIQLQWRRILSRHGASIVDLTSSGDECIAMAFTHRPDIILMDVGVQGTDGIEATRRILKHNNPCIVLVSGLPKHYSDRELEGLNIGGYIQKPIASSDFIRELAKCYGQSKQSAAD